MSNDLRARVAGLDWLRWAVRCLLLLTAVALSGCGGGGTTTTNRPMLQSISITASRTSVAQGTTIQLQATAVYNDNSKQDVTSQVTWASSNTAVATISAAGLLSAMAPGSVKLSATVSGVSGSLSCTVTNATLTAIQITPSAPTLSAGTSEQLTATGVFSDQSTQDLSSQVGWSSSSATVAKVAAGGLASAEASGTTTVAAAFMGVSGSTTLTVTAATLKSISVTPATVTLASGLTQPLTATGTYSDNSTQNLTAAVTWSSSDTSVATVSNAASSAGLASAVGAGTSTLTATLGGVSGSTTLTVSSATLVSISVTPSTPSIASGLTQQMTATGTYSDSSTHDLTTAVTWSSANTSVATISNAAGSAGLASAVGTGTSTITATLGSVSGSTTLTVTSAQLASIIVSPAIPSIATGLTQPFKATGTYTDSSMQDLTTAVTWSSSDTSVATISNASGSNGLASSVGAGTSTISATLGGVSGNTTLTVTSATLVSIAIAPATPSIASGLTQQLKALGTYSDSSTQDLTTAVTWSSSESSVATISNAAGSNGLASAQSAGTSTISATLGAVSGSTTLTVTAATLVSISVTPAASSIANGLSEPFTATGTYTDGSTQPLTTAVTWSSSETSVATISNAAGSNGLASAVGTGTTTISAALGSISGQTSLTVTVPSNVDTLSLLHSFAGGAADGAMTAGAGNSLLLGSDGNFYGMTPAGGASGLGTVFQLTPAGTVTLLYSFAGGTSDGATPTGGLVQSTLNGYLYGLTSAGGANGVGTFFEMSTAGSEVLSSNFSATVGSNPVGSLVEATDGVFYGMTSAGGANGYGTVFYLQINLVILLDYEVIDLYNFAGPPADGAAPTGSLIQATDGNFYGLTPYGGSGANSPGTVAGDGVAFEINTAGTETLLHSFTGGPADGAVPSGSLLQGIDGNFYGVTSAGGANGDGTVFEINSTTGVESVLYSFGGFTSDGMHPTGSLIQASDGTLYGVTLEGGAGNLGTIFMVTTAGVETVLYSFQGGTTDGAAPSGSLTLGSDGNLYGMTNLGGASGEGTLFVLTLH